jgi:hypothetical protein
MDVVINEADSKSMLESAQLYNKHVREQGLTDAPVFYLEYGELLLIKNGKLIASYQVTATNLDLYTEIKPIRLQEEDYKPSDGMPPKCFDFIMANNDQDIAEYVRDENGIAIWFNNNAYCLNIDEIIKLFEYPGVNNSIFYQCIEERPVPIQEKQYFLIRLAANFLVPVEDIRKMVRYNYQQGVKIFKIEVQLQADGSQEKLQYTMSHGVATHYINRLSLLREGESAVSADHCNARTDKLLYRIYPVTSELNDNNVIPSPRDSEEYQAAIINR